MSVFWKPFAYQACTDATEEDLQVLAREAMEALAHQITLISSTFGVEPPKTETTPQQEQLQEMIQQAVTAAMLNLVESGAIVMPQGHQSAASTATQPEGVLVDDALFAGLLTDKTPAPVN
ncbi:MAG: hypothetical protein HC929_05805 [Leptolyngbyaceae cyanobacterium SM2_5_2]|nr:hypothetical protein [Leptolyngbyaceae cyanobacterium SM2_5_2]